MDTTAALITPRGTGAISTIQLYGSGAKGIVGDIFKASGKTCSEYAVGDIVLGRIVDSEGKIIDQVLIGCEAENTYAVNCHGNPLIVESILNLLRGKGVSVLGRGEYLQNYLLKTTSLNAIEIESRICRIDSVTLDGARIIANQSGGGLNKILSDWLERIDSIEMGEIKSRVERILADSEAGGVIINGCRVVLAGGPNTGKSSILNLLAGREKSIVTEIEGTTRDYTSAHCRVGRLVAEVYDTAGLDVMLAGRGAIDRRSQEKSIEMIGLADVVLMVVDSSRGFERSGNFDIEKFGNKRVITILNKSDLETKTGREDLPRSLRKNCVRMSALTGDGVGELAAKIAEVLGVADFDMDIAVCFTSRQRGLLDGILSAEGEMSAGSLIRKLLNRECLV